MDITHGIFFFIYDGDGVTMGYNAILLKLHKGNFAFKKATKIFLKKKWCCNIIKRI